MTVTKVMEAGSGARQAGKKRRGSWLGRTWRDLATMRFALWLLLALALASVLAVACGEFLPTSGLADPAGYYGQKLSPAKFQLVKLLGLLNPYRSFWYLALLAGLGLSLAACLTRRLPGMVRMSFRTDPVESGEELRELKLHQRWRTREPLDETRVSGEVRKRGYRVIVNRLPGGGFSLAGSRNGIGRLGAGLNHIGLLALLIGGAVVALAASRTFMWINPGETRTAPDGSYAVVVDSFEVRMGDRGEISDYLSYVRVLENDRVTRSQVVEVNHPLRYRGFSWYQSSYRQLTDRVKTITVLFPGDPGPVRIAPGATVSSPDGTMRVQFAGFVSHYFEHAGRIMSRSAEMVDPAARFIVSRDGEEPVETWVRAAAPRTVPGFEEPPFYLAGFDPAYATGLEVKDFPGAAWIWVGFAAMTLGLMLSFMFDHRRVWIVASPGEGGTDLEAGGDIMHSASTFRREFERLSADLGAPKPKDR